MENGVSEGMHDLTLYGKEILKGLRELKKSSVVAFEVLKSLADGNDSSNVSFSYPVQIIPEE